MTRLVVLADTHMPRRARELPAVILRSVAEADMVIHLGDFTEFTLVDVLRELAPLRGIHGNNDSAEIRAIFPSEERLTINGHTLALIHGDVGGRTAVAAARNVSDVDVVLFGHSHRSCCENGAGPLLFNPGSPTDPRFSRQRSYGILEFGDSINASIIQLD